MNRNLRFEKQFRRSPEEAYRWFSDPARLGRWFFPVHWCVTNIVFEDRPGGRFEVHLRPANGGPYAQESSATMHSENIENASNDGMSVLGRIREADYGKRLSFSWRWRGPMEHWPETMVQIDFERIDAGCLVIVNQGLFESAEQEEAHVQGWNEAFVHLKDEGVID
ncbi:MAG: SRPBCC domain-containing protein [Leptospiraceae bacterium]|nr:SRPBCC domain-containing protein [Leptospiraceae bacterium]